MLIWGRPINANLEDILKDVREEATSHHGNDYVFRDMRHTGHDIFTTCPKIENHGGQAEHTPSCSISKEDGRVHCFGCDYKDSLPGTIAMVLGYLKPIDGFRWLLKKYTAPGKGQRPALGVGRTPRSLAPSYIPNDILELYNFDHPYMFKRGLTEEIIDLFSIGYDPESKSITIPMKDAYGRIMFIKKRPVANTKFHKYNIDEGAEKRDILYGLDIIRRNIKKVDMIWISEGEFDVMSHYVVGHFGGGLQGDRLFDGQIRQLIKYARGIPICIATDNDEAGRNCAARLVTALRPYFPLFGIDYPDVYREGKPLYKDPNDLLKAGLLENIPTYKIGAGS